MVLINTPVGNFMRISGTIGEVMTEMADQNIVKAQQVAYYTDDDTNAVALVGRIAN